VCASVQLLYLALLGTLQVKGKERRIILKRIISDEEAIRKNFAKKTLFGTSLVGGTVARGNFETGKVESYFNERVRRYGFSGSFASYLGAFVGAIRMKEGDKDTVTVTSDQWLVWKFEGEYTLESYLAPPNDANFPYNIEYAVLKKTNDNMEDGRRQTTIIKSILWPILAALRDMHRVGIVHRDIKPANLLVNENAGTPIKLIDLGAAVDLRTGVNFNPETGLLDPKYAPPEQLVVPQEVPRAPPRFVALLGSPALWQLTSPDRFDTYSVGVLLMQLSVPEMRSGKQLDNFKSQLRSCGENLQRWREDFGDNYDLSLLDRNKGHAWDLAQQLIRPRNLFQRGRLSARQAMGHRYFWPEL
jgi:serine/threonine protein kinase